MKHLMLISLLCLGLSGCGALMPRLGLPGPQGDPAAPASPEAEQVALAPDTRAPPPPADAKTAAALDTTTPAQRASAARPATASSRDLGRTVVSLGSPTEPGLWLKTPLVRAQFQGRVTDPASGKSSRVTVIPIDGPATGGSRMSLAAMRLIGLSLTDLTEVAVALED
ncbi:MAG: hypothetical protein ACJAVM_000802 [Sulfitobacter sp.]|jgi:hypothetical protein